ncbi:hypothetical protein M3B46_19125 [Sphingobacterium daejeonense]|uniref:hypothetical protein n=1 Tax=Sphingobacterium daejeonense TaxID=371142 RepID=UPI0021A96C2F|nr:hypothetical protein [Sphingobacterium daejeonense]MCT1533118.1 hypothetical protein [Sphingobacterium daejeonense]
MRQFVSVLMMFLSLLIGFQQTIIYTHFILNQKQIEEQYCINKNRPALNCHGQCFLKKKLEKAQNKNDKKNLLQNYKKVDLYAAVYFELLPKSLSVNINKNYSSYKDKTYKEPELEIFIPPPLYC